MFYIVMQELKSEWARCHSLYSMSLISHIIKDLFITTKIITGCFFASCILPTHSKPAFVLYFNYAE